MKKKIIVSLIIVSIIFFLIIGFAMGRIFEKANQQIKFSQIQEEINLLKFQVEILYPPLPEEIYGVLGSVTEIGDKFLVMEAQIQVSRFPLPEGKDFETRNIRVNMAEEIEIFQAEMLEPSLSEEPSKKISLGLKDMGVKPTQLTRKQPTFQKFRPDYALFQNLQNLH